MSRIMYGTKNGESRRGPSAPKTRVWSWNSFIPPIPLPITTPTRVLLLVRHRGRVEAGIGQGLVGGDDGVLREGVHAAGLLAVDVVARRRTP